MKTYQQFKEETERNILRYLPEHYWYAEVYIDQIPKNNDTFKDVLVIKLPSQHIAPLMYLDGYYEDYVHHGSIEQALQKMADTVLEVEKEHHNINVEQIINYEKVKDQIILQVINEDSNKNRLQDVPAKKIADTDLTAVFRVMLDTPDGSGSVLVNQQMMARWNIGLEALYGKALENTQRENPFTLQSMLSVMLFFMQDNPPETEANQLPEQLEGCTQYVLSSVSHINGAVTLLYPHLLEEMGKRFDSNFFILPSSIHEILLIKDTGEMDAVELQRMVIEINQSQVEPEEVLSNQVFSYNYRDNTLSKATTKEETEKLLEQCSGGIEATYEEEWER